MTQRCNMLRCRFFTLLELLIVVAVIAILASLLLPALNKAIDKAKSISCSGNLKQLGLGIGQYTSDYSDYLPISQKNWNLFGTTATWPGTWVAEIAPYCGKPKAKERKKETGSGIFLCKSFYPEMVFQNPESFTADSYYLALGYGWNIQMGYLDTDLTYNLQKNTTGTYPRMKTNALKTPSQKILCGDSADTDGGANGHSKLRQLFSPYLSYGSFGFPSTAQMVSIRHSIGGNYAMGDGHVTYFRQSYLVGTLNKHYTRD